MATVPGLEDLQQYLSLNRSASFILDLQAAQLHKSLSFITPQDVKDEHRPVPKPILGHSAPLLESWDEEEDWRLTPDHLRLTSYECLLLSNNAVYLHAINKASGSQSSNGPNADPSVDAIWNMQKRLGISDAKHTLIVQKLTAALATAPQPVSPISCNFHLCMLSSLVQDGHTATRKRDSGPVADVEEGDAPSTEDMHSSHDSDDTDLLALQLRHLCILANCVIHVVNCNLNTHTTTVLPHSSSPKAQPDGFTPIMLFMANSEDFEPEASNPRSAASSVALRSQLTQLKSQFRKLRTSLIQHSQTPTPESEAGLLNALDNLDRDILALHDICRKSPSHASAQTIPRPPVSLPARTQSPCRAQLPSPLLPQPPSSAPPSLQHCHLLHRFTSPESPVSTGSNMSQSIVQSHGLGFSSSPSPDDVFPAQEGSSPPPILSLSLDASQEVNVCTIPYMYPLNAHLYSELLNACFVDLDDDGSRLDFRKKPKLTQHVQLWRTRRQEARLKEVVDMTSGFRADFHISNFLHACCFAYVIFCRYLDGLLNEEEMHRLLSVDCYFFPGFQALCEASNLTVEEETRRQDVLQQMGMEFMTRLADYHCEYPSTPGDILFVLRLYVMLSISRHNPSNSGMIEGSTSQSSLPGEVQTFIQEEATQDEVRSGGQADSEMVNSTLRNLAKAFGSDVLDVVAECMEHGGLKEAKALSASITIPVYMELLCAIINSAYRHYLRVKAKVTHVMQDLKSSNDLFRTSPLFRDEGHPPVRALQLVARPTAAGKTGRSATVLKPLPPYSEQCSSVVLSVPQLMNLVEVMLFELHSECQNFLPCFTGAIPSAVTYSMNHYLRLLSMDVRATLKSVSLRNETTPVSDAATDVPACRESQEVTSFVADVDGHSGSPLQFTPVHRPSCQVAFESPFSLAAQSPATEQTHEPYNFPNVPFGLTPRPPPLECDGRLADFVESGKDEAMSHVSTADIRPIGSFVDRSSLASAMSCTSPLVGPRHRLSTCRGSASHDCPAPSSVSFAGTVIGVFDVVSLSLLNANYVYIALLLSILQANCNTYINFPASGFTWDKPSSTAHSPSTPRSQTSRWTGWVHKDKDKDKEKEREKPRWGRGSTSSTSRGHQEDAFPPEALGSELSPGPSWPPSECSSGLRLTSALLSSCTVASNETFRLPEPQRAKSFVNERLSEVVSEVVGQWRTIMCHSREKQLWRLLQLEEWKPVGSVEKEPMSSSAVNMSAMMDQMMALVKHGIGNAFEVFKKGFHTTTLTPLSSLPSSEDQSLLPEFLGSTASVLKMYRGLCAELCSMFYARYCDKLAEPLRCHNCVEPTWQQTIAAVDETLLTEYPLKRVAMQMNNILFCRSHLTTLQAMAASFLCPGSGAAAAANQATMAPPMLSEEALAAGNAALSTLCFLFGYQIIGGPLRRQMRKLYSSKAPECRMEGVIQTLHPLFSEAAQLILMTYRYAVAREVLKQVTHGLFCVVTKGKIKACEPASIFIKVMEDIKALKEYFTMPQMITIPAVTENDAQTLVNDVIVAAMAILSRNPPADVLVCMMLNGRGDHGFCVSRYTVLSILDLFPGAADSVHEVLAQYLRWLTKEAAHEREERKLRDSEQISFSTEFTAEKESGVGDYDADHRDKGRKISRMCSLM